MVHPRIAVLESARRREGWTLDELAGHAQLSVEDLGQIVREEYPGDTVQWAKLAEALDLEPWALMDGVEARIPSARVFLRHSAHQDFAPEDDAVVQGALDAARVMDALRGQLGARHADALRGSFPRSVAALGSPEAARDGYRRAAQVRRALAQGPHPIGDAEVVPDLRELIEARFGFPVLVRRMHTRDATAMSVRDPHGAGAIVVHEGENYASARLVRRVLLAHELCHLLFDPGEEGLQLVVERDLEGRATAAEQRAGAFAAELLIPEAGLRGLLGSPTATASPEEAGAMVDLVRRHFVTPWTIAGLHLVNRGYLDAVLVEWVRTARTSGVEAASSSEEWPACGGPSLGVRRLLEAAWRQCLVTDGQARKVLGMELGQMLPFEG